MMPVRNRARRRVLIDLEAGAPRTFSRTRRDIALGQVEGIVDVRRDEFDRGGPFTHSGILLLALRLVGRIAA